MRHRNDGLRKVCACPRRTWAKCPHPWHFNFKWRGVAYRFSLDRQTGERIVTKADAKAAADRLRREIRDGVFDQAPAPVVTAPTAITLDVFAARYLERAVEASGKKTARNDATILKMVCAFTPAAGGRLGDKPVGTITEDDLELVLADLRARGRAAHTRNHYVQVIKAAFRWGTKKGYLPHNPIPADTSLRREKGAQRHRRLGPGEEDALLGASGPRLRRLIVAALETGCRQGELLALQWGDVNLTKREITVRAEHTKDGETRVIPISARLLAELQMAQYDPAGETLPPQAHVFGDELGGQLASPKKAWDTAVLKAHGLTPAWQPGTHQLAPASRAALRRIGLHFHDLRHEAGSRLIEAGVPLHHVKEILGHADIKTTSTYLNATLGGLHESIRKIDELRARCKPVANEAPTAPPPLCNPDQPGGPPATVH